MSNLIVTVRRTLSNHVSIYEDTLWLRTRSWDGSTEENSFVEFGTWVAKVLEVCQVGWRDKHLRNRATCIPIATHHKLKPSIIAKEKEKAKLAHDRDHHTPEESAQLGNCSLSSSSRNRGSSFVVAASRVMFDGNRHRSRMMRQYVDTISAASKTVPHRVWLATSGVLETLASLLSTRLFRRSCVW